MSRMFEQLEGRRFLSASPAVLEGDTLTLKGGGIDITESLDGSWTISRGANTIALTAAEVNQIETIQLKGGKLDISGAAADTEDFLVTGNGKVNISDVTIVEASSAGAVSADSNIADITFQNDGTVTVNGTRAEYFITVWDELDDRYGVEGYYAVDTNTAFIHLGIEYVEYLDAGNLALTSFTAKYSGTDEAPTRDQSIHDNLLGNFDPTTMADRGLSHLYSGEYTTRPYYGGNTGENQLPSVQWDFDHGVNRDDYAEFGL